MIIQWHMGKYIDRGMSPLLQLAADTVLAIEGIDFPCGIGLHIVGDKKIREINRSYRGIDRATDVLSFPEINYPKGKRGGQCKDIIKKNYDDEINAAMLGDIFISIEHVAIQAIEYGHTQMREAAYLLVHGILHLLGYDHMEKGEKGEMRAMEENALSKIGVVREPDMIDKENMSEAEIEELLLNLARQAMERAYVPYSKYRVGAALLSTDGRIFQGCNVENASFGLTNCGERTAVFKAISEGANEFDVIAIAAKGSAPWPCGACRQVLNEFAPDIKILVTWDDGKVARSSLLELLPHGFGPKDLP